MFPLHAPNRPGGESNHNPVISEYFLQQLQEIGPPPEGKEEQPLSRPRPPQGARQAAGKPIFMLSNHGRFTVFH